MHPPSRIAAYKLNISLQRLMFFCFGGKFIVAARRWLVYKYSRLSGFIEATVRFVLHCTLFYLDERATGFQLDPADFFLFWITSCAVNEYQKTVVEESKKIYIRYDSNNIYPLFYLENSGSLDPHVI